MQTFKQFILEFEPGGAKPGKLDITKIDLQTAEKYAMRAYRAAGRDFEEEFPDFARNFKLAKSKAAKGHTLRKHMPVLSRHIDVLKKFVKKHDERVTVKTARVPVKKLEPIQKQIYFDKVITHTASEKREKTLSILKSKTLIASSDFKIIDGHHRYLSAMLIDPNMKLHVLVIDLPMDELLPLTRKLSDNLGIKRNEQSLNMGNEETQ